MKTSSHTIFSLVITLILIGSCQTTKMSRQNQESKYPIDNTHSVMINLTSDPEEDPHSILMGLHMAQKTQKNGIPTSIFLNVHGVKLMSPIAQDIEFHGERLLDVLIQIMEDGGKVFICPHCMKAHEINKSHLMPTVDISDEQLLIQSIKNQPTVFTY